MQLELDQIRVNHAMSRDVVTVSPGDSLHEALELIVENRVAALPVVNGRGCCVGMLSTSDLIDLTHELDDEFLHLDGARWGDRRWLIEQLSNSLNSESVSDQMTDSVASIGPDSSLALAAGEMLRNRVHRLPVVDQKKRLLGIISTVDIMRVVADGAVL